MYKTLVDNNYIILPEFIHQADAKTMAFNFKNFCFDYKIGEDQQVKGSVAYQNYIDFLELLCEKTPEISRLLGETVLPTYAYSRIYQFGNVLQPHIDREACEISVTVHLEGSRPWPIYIEKPDGTVAECNLNSGDAMLYLGCKGKHWREKFQGQEYVQVFLHYVRSRGDNSFAYFDKVTGKSLESTNIGL